MGVFRVENKSLRCHFSQFTLAIVNKGLKSIDEVSVHESDDVLTRWCNFILFSFTLSILVLNLLLVNGRVLGKFHFMRRFGSPSDRDYSATVKVFYNFLFPIEFLSEYWMLLFRKLFEFQECLEPLIFWLAGSILNNCR